jgi:4-hydroxybenzoate polyprenyltransferase
MKQVRKYWKLFRVKISLAFFFPLAFGFAIAADADPHITWWKIPVGFLAFFCATFFASTLNFYADVASDKDFGGGFKDTDLSKQPFVKGEMGRAETWLALGVSFAACAGLSLAVNHRFAVFIVGFALVVGILYSHPLIRLKAKPVTDILCNIVGMGFSLLAGLSLGGSSRLPPVMFLVWGALFVVVMYIPTVVNDVPFDRAAGYQTSGVYFGASRLLYSMAPLAIAMVPLGVFLAFDGSIAWLYRFAAAAGTPLTLAGTAVIFYLWRPPKIELNPDVVLFPMDLAIAALVIYGSILVARG